MDISDLFEIVLDEYAAYQEAGDDKRAYLVDRSAELYGEFLKPIDLPGPDYILDPLAEMALKAAVGAIYDAIEAKFSSDDDGIDLIVGAGRFRLNRQKRRELGVTFLDFLRELKAMKADGALDSVDSSNVPDCLIVRLRNANPKLAAEAELDPLFWEKLLEWIRFLLPFLMFLI